MDSPAPDFPPGENYVFPAQPLCDPSGPERDGFADITFTAAGMELTLAEGRTVLIPSRTIRKSSMVIKPGGPTDVNRVQIELLAGEVTVRADSYLTEFHVQRPLVADA